MHCSDALQCCMHPAVGCFPGHALMPNKALQPRPPQYVVSQTSSAPAAPPRRQIGYSGAVVMDNFVFVSGCTE